MLADYAAMGWTSKVQAQMLSWFRRRRESTERIDAKANTLIRAFGVRCLFLGTPKRGRGRRPADRTGLAVCRPGGRAQDGKGSWSRHCDTDGCHCRLLGTSRR